MTLLSRRQFIAGLAASAVVIGAPPIQIAGRLVEPEEFGRGVRFAYRRTLREKFDPLEVALEWLVTDAGQHLRPGDLYEIRMGPPRDYGTSINVGWYRHKSMGRNRYWRDEPSVHLRREALAEAKYDPALGVYVIGRFTAQGASP